MATPSPTPTAAQLESFAEITVTDSADALTTVSAYAQDTATAKWAATLLDIADWSAGMANEANDIKRVGNVEFFENNIGVSRLYFRNKVRQRYGLPAILDETGSSSLVAIRSLEYF